MDDDIIAGLHVGTLRRLRGLAFGRCPPTRISLAVAGIVTILSACGGERTSEVGGNSTQVAPTSAQFTARAPQTSRPEPTPKRRSRAPERRKRAKSRSPRAPTMSGLKSLSRAQRIMLARAAAQGAFQAAGFADAKVTVDRDGYRVQIGLRRATLCSASMTELAGLTRRLKQLDPLVRHVRVVVDLGGQRPAADRVGRCKREDFPPLGGPVVLSLKGSGFVDTKPFTVRSARWTLQFYNESSYFQAFLVKHGKIQSQVVSQSSRRFGSKTFTGSGTFSLKIGASGPWRLRVVDHA